MPDQGMTFDTAPVKQDTPVQPAPSQDSSGMTFDSAPVNQDTHVTTPEPSTLGRLVNGAVQLHNDITTGIGQGALDTVHGTGELIRRGLNAVPFVNDLGNKVVPPEGQTALDQLATPTNTAQKVGFTAENIAEFMLGDEALKGLSLADKMPKVARAMEVLQKQPVLKNQIIQKMIATGARQGLTGGLQGFVHSGGDAVRAGEEGAATATFGAATEGVPAAKDAIKDAYKSVLDTKSVQPVLQQGIRDTLAKVAEDSGVIKSAAPSIRDVANDTADAVYAKSKGQYQVLDDATGGRVQRFKDRLDNIRQSLDGLTGTEEDVAKEASLLKAQKETEAAMQEAFDDARAKGVDPKLIDEATANFKKSQALYDLDKHLKMSASGMRPDVGTSAKNPEAVDPNKMFSRMNRLYDSGRLQEAVGQQNAESLLDHANNAYIQQQKILGNQALAKTVGKYAAHAAELGTGGALAAHYIGHLF
jgi:hypothetical protein